MPSEQVCIDASVALKLLVVEEDSDRARWLWRSWARESTRPVAPALLLFECVSALRTLVARRTVHERVASAAVKQLQRMPITFPAPEGLVERTWEMAGRFKRPQAYDCFYLAIAQLLGVPFWSADQWLYNAVRRELSWVHILEEVGTSAL